MITVDLDNLEKEHEDWIRHAAVDLSVRVNKYERNLAVILRDAQIITDFILAKPSAEIIRLNLIPKTEQGA